jgi:thiol-disulfide isomerase/thioredoxin
MMKRWLTVGAVLAVAGCAVAQDQSGGGTAKAQQPQMTAEGGVSRPDYMPGLMVGDNAPSFFIESWVKGDAITGLEKGRVYVVEFWATWCLPCRESMPHLTKVQEQFKNNGVTVVGITSSESNGLEDVVPFVEKQGSALGYTVAWDDNGKTDAAWRKAAGQTSIPSAFIVDGNGKIAWVGHPMYPAGEMDEVLAKVVNGSFDVNDAADKERAAFEMMHRAQALWSEGEQRLALEVLGGLVDLNAKRFSSAAMQKFQGLLLQLNDTEGGYAWANQLIDGPYKDNAGVLTEIAWTILEAPGLENRDLNVAMRAAKLADEVSGGNSAAALDTLARVHFAMGDFAKAYTLQSRAFELVTDERMKDLVKGRLEQYRQAAVETK